MRVNYNGLHAHSLRTLWVSPFLADVEWGIGRRDPSQDTESELETTIELWKEAAAKEKARFMPTAPSAPASSSICRAKRG